jgi:hypothetical protein
VDRREPDERERREWEAEFEADDVIRSREAGNRAKYRESLPRLRAFRDYWLRARR